MPSSIVGNCNCGAVTVTLTQGVPAEHALCGCTSCRKSGGSIYSYNLIVPDDQLVVSGPVKTYTSNGSSGNPVHRDFCPTCGSPIRTRAAAPPGASFVKGGLFPPGSLPKPAMRLFHKNAEEWEVAFEGTKQVEEQ